MLFAGIDIGSLSTETVLIDPQGQVVTANVLLTGASSVRAAEASLQKALADAGVTREDIVYCVATGYGRNKVPTADARITEITCHAKGAAVLFPGVRTVIDIGGQDSKVIRVDNDGGVADFVMNDKCAAGTGRFLEVMARTLEVDLEELGALALQSDADIKVSSMCTVFAESEVVGLIGEGVSAARIAWGVCRSVSDRVASLAERVGVTLPVAMTGGVANNRGVVRALETRLGVNFLIADNPQIVGALGAAHLAKQRREQKQG
jgi:predicted CoA-substrate-specific enzyme activase